MPLTGRKCGASTTGDMVAICKEKGGEPFDDMLFQSFSSKVAPAPPLGHPPNYHTILTCGRNTSKL